MSVLPHDHHARMDRVRLSLDGLSLGDSFGQQIFHRQNWTTSFRARELPPGPWRYTDDTEMALGIAEVLDEYQTIHQDRLAHVFATRYALNPYRGYGSGAHDILSAIGRGESWQVAAQQAFDGQGSLGNGGAMRAPPVGAYFADDNDETVVEQARLSAEVTHHHLEGIAGAIAVAIAAAWAARRWAKMNDDSPAEMFSKVIAHTPSGETRSRIQRAANISLTGWQHHAAEQLGNGGCVTAADTVPFCLWIVARHLDDFTEALWTTAHVGGDIDTNCAIVGGILALAVGREGLPTNWLRQREPLPQESGRE
jgi:ADP-ribosylglycohydrolase